MFTPRLARFWFLASWLLLLLMGGQISAEPLPVPRAFVRQFGPADGLSQPFIYCLLQDRQGYLWLGTADGLVRFDGTRFTTLTVQDGLAENFVTGLWEEPTTGHLWVAHYQGSRSVRTAPGTAFQALAPKAALPPSWRPSASGAPVVDTARLQAYLRRYSLQLPTDAQPSCLLEDRAGNAWLGTIGQGLWRHSDRFASLLPLPTSDLSAGVVLAAYSSKEIPSLYGAVGPNALALNSTMKAGQVVTEASVVPSSLGPVRAVLARPVHLGGGIWQGVAHGGLWLAATPGAAPTRVPGLPATLDVAALAYSPHSGLWVGTVADGVYFLPGAGVAARPAVHFTTANGLLHNQIHSLLADHTGRIWVATHGTGLAAWEPKRHRFVHHRLHLSGLAANALAEDAAGTIWVGTEGQGLYYCPAGPAVQWHHLGATSKGLPDDHTSAIVPIGKQLLLVHPQALSLLDVGNHTVHRLDLLARNFLPAAIAEGGPHPDAWVATQTGLLRLDLQALANWTHQPAPTPTLALTDAEVDGESHSATSLGELTAQNHRLSFALKGLSLAPSAGQLLYQYRLRGLADEWSHPSPAGEAQFVGLGAGHYLLEARVRYANPATASWSSVVSTSFSIATPWWRRGWVLAMVALAVGGGIFTIVRTREGLLRRQRAQLELTVRQRTRELRQQKSHIEQINADLLVARDAAEASRRAKAQFLANMSHEIRTPMNAVIGLTNLLQQTQTTREQREYLSAIGSSSQNLLVILNDILDSSKMEAGKLSLEQVPFRLPDTVRRLSTLFRYTADSKGLLLRVEVDENVPPAVLGDPVRLQQILVNLVSNALKFTRQGDVAVHVGLVLPSTTLPGTDPTPLLDAQQVVLRFAVQDSGIGIPADKLTTIFEDFAQANASTTREFGGTGLGLSIARNLVQLQGGQLSVRSSEGVGSEFFFELTYPVADTALAHPEAYTGPLPIFEPALRVLVAEDNELNQLVARKTLENWNVRVVIAANGRLAVEEATQADEPFDAVLMDVQMPELDGYAATRALRVFFPDEQQLPIIGLTASVLPEDRGLALAAGMNDTLAKPFDPATLHARLAFFTGRQFCVPNLVLQEALALAHAEAPLPLSTQLNPSWELLEELAGGNQAFIQQIIATFLLEAPLLEKQLAASFPHDTAKLVQVAHKLKGQVAYFAVPVLHAQLDELERNARRPDYEPSAPLLLSITQHLEQLYARLQERA